MMVPGWFQYFSAWLGVCCLLTLCESRRVDTTNYKDAIVNKHNLFRRTEYASDMKKLYWSERLVWEAEKWVENCRFEHQGGPRGENIFYSTSQSDVKFLLLKAVDEWHDELTTWQYSKGHCGFACHYTQIVWARTNQVGCAAKRCNVLYDKGTQIDNALFVACYYNPKGNVIGTAPFTQGPSCSKCSTGAECSDGLCDPMAHMMKPTTATTAAVTQRSAYTSGGACADRLPSCPNWKGSCATNKAVRLSCPQSCNLCNTLPPPQLLLSTSPPCEDDPKYASSCKYWDNKGFCQHNLLMRQVYCMKTCRTCI